MLTGYYVLPNQTGNQGGIPTFPTGKVNVNADTTQPCGKVLPCVAQ